MRENKINIKLLSGITFFLIIIKVTLYTVINVFPHNDSLLITVFLIRLAISPILGMEKYVLLDSVLGGIITIMVLYGIITVLERNGKGKKLKIFLIFCYFILVFVVNILKMEIV